MPEKTRPVRRRARFSGEVWGLTRMMETAAMWRNRRNLMPKIIW